VVLIVERQEQALDHGAVKGFAVDKHRTVLPAFEQSLVALHGQISFVFLRAMTS
jgi:hypothetical protein